MPFTILGALFANRTSWFAEEGVTPDNFPTTWEEYRAVGKKLKAKNRPFGTDAGARVRRRSGVLVSLPVVMGRQGGRG